MARAATLLVTGLLLVGCNTVAGLKTDLGLAGEDQAGTVQPPEAGQFGGATPVPVRPEAARSGSSTPPADTAADPAGRPEARYATVVQPGELRAAPSPDGKVVGHASIGDTYELFDWRGGWVQIGADETPVAWIVATLLAPSASAAGVPPQ